MEWLSEFAKYEKIDVIEKKLPPRISGFYYRNGSKRLICIEKDLDKKNKRITFAEELGYHFCSKGKAFLISKKVNNAPNTSDKKSKDFEARFLIPDNIVEAITHYIDIYPLQFIADKLGVTEDLLKLRLKL